MDLRSWRLRLALADCLAEEALVQSLRGAGPRFVNILLVDDHPLFRDGLKHLLLKLSDSLQVSEADDSASAIERARSSDFDLVLLDLRMPGSRGIDALDAFREACPGTPVVVLSGEGTPSLVRAAIEGGAMGFIPKTSTHEILIQALKLVLLGGVYLPRSVLAAEPPPAQVPGLTPRQLEVLRGIIHGKPNKVIAKDLELSEHTVKAHLSTVYGVLGASNRTEAVYKAAKLGVPLF